MIDLALLLTLLLALGFVAQWVAWRVRVPAILFLLLTGIVIGPVTGWFDPQAAFGDMLFPSISLAVALILFEGSMTLRLGELPEVGRAVRGMISYGALLALALLAAAAHWVAGLDWGMALLFGALTCVTGPTVIMPMLRTLRPNARIASTLRWEGILMDPLGALLAVLVYEALMAHHQQHPVTVFILTILAGTLVGVAMGWLLGKLLTRERIPEFLHNYAALAMVLLAFSLSNRINDETGLLAVTVMGITLGNMREVYTEHIMDFKENLSTLLVSMLFVVLAARLPWPLPPGALWSGIIIFLLAQFLIRPLSVIVATAGSKLTWPERALISYVVPRGVVAAAVSSLFALRMQDLGIPHADMLVPLVFILIIGTVVLESATARPLACRLKVADPDPTGVMIYGSDEVARAVAKALGEQNLRVLLADDDWDGISAARMAGLETFYGNPVSLHAEVHMDLTGIGHFLAMSSRRELNSLACMQYRQIFGRERVYRLHILKPATTRDRHTFADSIQSKSLFGQELTHRSVCKRLASGWYIKTTQLTEAYDWPRYLEHNGEKSALLFAMSPAGKLNIADGNHDLVPKPGWTVMVLVPPDAPAAPPKRLMQETRAVQPDIATG